MRKSVSLTKSAQKDVPDKSARKSLVNEPSPEIVEAPTKKRGRPRKSGADSDVEVVDAGEEERRAKKKSRKSEGRKAERATSPEEPVGNMKGYLQIASWEHLVDTVDTVERDIDGELIVYFTLYAHPLPTSSTAFVTHSPPHLQQKQRRPETRKLCAVC